jgi:hypothetical protein
MASCIPCRLSNPKKRKGVSFEVSWSLAILGLPRSRKVGCSYTKLKSSTLERGLRKREEQQFVLDHGLLSSFLPLLFLSYPLEFTAVCDLFVMEKNVALYMQDSQPSQPDLRSWRRASCPSLDDPEFYNLGEEEEEVNPSDPNPKQELATWCSLPRKDQLAILFLSRLVDFLQVASLQAYVFYQLKSFNPSLSDSSIATQAGILQGCFTGAQVLTAILWGKVADASWCGRKIVLLIGLGGTAVSCLGYGFSTTFFWAAFFRVFGGAVNGTVGIMLVFFLGLKD